MAAAKGRHTSGVAARARSYSSQLTRVSQCRACAEPRPPRSISVRRGRPLRQAQARPPASERQGRARGRSRATRTRSRRAPRRPPPARRAAGGLLGHDRPDARPPRHLHRRGLHRAGRPPRAHRRGRCALYDNLPLQPAPKDGLRMRLNETLLVVRQGSSPPPVLSHHPVLYSTHSSLFFYSLCLFTLFLPPLAIHHRHPASSADSRESQQTGTLHRQSLLLSTRGRVASAQRARDVDTGTSKTRIARERERERE